MRLESYRDADPIVLGIVLGGVPVAHEVASHLGASLDLIIIRRLLAPDGPGSQLCAVNVAGSLVIDDQITVNPTPSTALEYFIADALSGLDNREKICRNGPPVELNNRTVLLVDCGIRTGLTMKAAAGALRKLRPKRIIAAVPVVSTEGSAAVAHLLDDTVYLMKPEVFGNAGVWYRDFRRPDDAQVAQLINLQVK